MSQQPGADESYRVSSRDTAVLARQYMAALSAQDAHCVNKYQLNLPALPNLPLAQIAPVDNNSGTISHSNLVLVLRLASF